MSLLAPWALLWLGSIPALLWLWRLASTQRQIRVPSLIPFEYLLKRAPKWRTRLVVTSLFWLQLAALLGLTLSLARPILFQRRAKTILVVLDTSASMGAGLQGPSAFAQAKQTLLARIARKATTDQFFIMTTSPAAPLMQQPANDTVALTRAIQELRVSHLGGNLSTTAHIGRALLAADPDETVVVTDETRPTELPEGDMQWVTVGAPYPNVAIVGLDARGPLCSAEEAGAVVTVQNFSNALAPVTVAATQRLPALSAVPSVTGQAGAPGAAQGGGRRLTEAKAEFAPNERRSIPLAMPKGTEGWVELSLIVPGDGLDVDNRAWINLHRRAALPIVVRSRTTSFKDTMSMWLGACDALTWAMDAPSGDGPALVITDREEEVFPAAVASMVFSPPTTVRPVLSHWVVSSGHPVGSYLAPVEVVAASLNLSAGTGSSGVPVVTALLDGRNVPVVVADEREGRRAISIRLDPAPSRDSTPLLLAFFNGLRWLMGQAEPQTTQTTGEPLLVSGFKPGSVSVHRPDGSTESLKTSGGVVVYDTATLAGMYRFSQGPSEMSIAVNFFDPLESNLLGRVTTWRVFHGPSATAPIPRPQPAVHDSRGGRIAQPLSNLLMALILVLLLIEWWRYSAKGQSAVHRR